MCASAELYDHNRIEAFSFGLSRRDCGSVQEAIPNTGVRILFTKPLKNGVYITRTVGIGGLFPFYDFLCGRIEGAARAVVPSNRCYITDSSSRNLSRLFWFLWVIDNKIPLSKLLLPELDMLHLVRIFLSKCSREGVRVNNRASSLIDKLAKFRSLARSLSFSSPSSSTTTTFSMEHSIGQCIQAGNCYVNIP